MHQSYRTPWMESLDNIAHLEFSYDLYQICRIVGPGLFWYILFFFPPFNKQQYQGNGNQ